MGIPALPPARIPPLHIHQCSISPAASHGELPASSAGHEQPEVWSHPTTQSARCDHHGLQTTSAKRDARGPSTRGREGACPLPLPDATHPPGSEGSSLLLPRIPGSCSCSFQWGNSAHSYPGLQECKQPVLHVFELQPRCSTCAANRSPLLAEAPLLASTAWCSLPWVPPALVLLQVHPHSPPPHHHCVLLHSTGTSATAEAARSWPSRPANIK